MMPKIKAPKTTNVNAEINSNRRRQMRRHDDDAVVVIVVVVVEDDNDVTFEAVEPSTSFKVSFRRLSISTSSSFKTTIRRQRPGKITMNADAHAPDQTHVRVCVCVCVFVCVLRARTRKITLLFCPIHIYISTNNYYLK